MLRIWPRSHPTRRSVGCCLRDCSVLLWMVVGIISYGSIWMLLFRDVNQSYTSIASTHQMTQELRQRIMEEQALSEQVRRNLEQKRREQKQKNIRQRRKFRRTEGGDGETFFDWSFWGLCVCFALMAYVRIRLEPSRGRDWRRRRRRELAWRANNDEAHVIQTLRRLNRVREARGETPITMDAYQALRMALLQDQTLLRGLAGISVPPPSRGATPEQVASCQQRVISEDDNYDGECCICLAPYEANDQVRILPCSHSYHKDCIDHWLERSVLCPLCKTPLETPESSD